MDNLRAMGDTLDSGFKDMLDTSNSFSTNMESVEEEIRRMRESLVDLEFKSERAVLVEGLTAQVDLMTEEKARQDERTASELDNLAQKIAELNEAASKRLSDVDIYSQGVNTKIEELENSIEDKFTEQRGKLVSLEEKVNEDRMELTEKSEENKLIVQKFTEQQNSIEKMFSDIDNHSTVLEEILQLKERQMSRIDGLGQDMEKKLGKLSGDVTNLDVKVTNNISSLGESETECNSFTNMMTSFGCKLIQLS